MKKLSKISIKNLEKAELSNQQQSKIKGGFLCTCGCCYVGEGGSSTVDNCEANCEIHTTTLCDDIEMTLNSEFCPTP